MNWLKIKYPAGAGGKIVMYCLSTSDKVVDLVKDEDPVEFVEKYFPNKKGILPIEDLGYPYDITWFTRQYPFTRGHELDARQVSEIIGKDEILKTAQDNNFLVPFHWTRLDSPTWFKGKIFKIGVTRQSKNWLMNRRSQLFYKQSGNDVVDLRHHPSNPLQGKYSNFKFTDKALAVYRGQSVKDVAEKHFIQDRCMEFTNFDISIEDLLRTDRHDLVIDKMETCLEHSIDRSWTKTALDTWSNIWN